MEEEEASAISNEAKETNPEGNLAKNFPLQGFMHYSFYSYDSSQVKANSKTLP